MTYYRVKSQYDNKIRYMRTPHHPTPNSILIGRELYTPTEFKRLAMCHDWFEKVEVPKNRIYWSLGARFEIGCKCCR